MTPPHARADPRAGSAAAATADDLNAKNQTASALMLVAIKARRTWLAE
jgi:hypothetical protein